MIRIIVLIGLLAVIFYCAFAGPARAGELADYAGKSIDAASSLRRDLRAQRQSLPGSLAVLHGHVRELAGVVSTRASIDPNA